MVLTCVAEARGKKNLTQADLAQKLGVRQSTIARWEIGVRLPKRKFIKNLATELDLCESEIEEQIRELLP